MRNRNEIGEKTMIELKKVTSTHYQVYARGLYVADAYKSDILGAWTADQNPALHPDYYDFTGMMASTLSELKGYIRAEVKRNLD